MVTAVIQARMGSSRLPGKALLPLGRQPMLLWIAAQASAATSIGKVTVSTGLTADNDALETVAIGAGLDCFRGEVDDIVGRLAKAAEETGADYLLRLWGDCPFVFPEVIDRLVDMTKRQNLDFASTARRDERTLPFGLDMEIYRASFLAKMSRDLKDRKLREFPVEYVLRHRDELRIDVLHHAEDLSRYHLAVDYPQDLAAANAIIEQLPENRFTLESLVALLKSKPDLALAFANAPRNVEYKAFLDDEPNSPLAHEVNS